MSQDTTREYVHIQFTSRLCHLLHYIIKPDGSRVDTQQKTVSSLQVKPDQMKAFIQTLVDSGYERFDDGGYDIVVERSMTYMREYVEGQLTSFTLPEPKKNDSLLRSGT